MRVAMANRARQYLLGLAMLLCLPAAAPAAPAFTAVDIGDGVPLDVNATGAILGLDSYSGGVPWVLAGGTRIPLPVPAGSTAVARRIGTTGAVVGRIGSQAAVWWPSGGGYTLELLPFPAGATAGEAVDVNGWDFVLVSYGTSSTLPTGLTVWSYKPWVYRRDVGLSDPAPASVSLAEAVDLTDGGRILLRSGEVVEPGGQVTSAPAFPDPPLGGYHWIALRATRINDAGSFIGVATLSSSLDYAQVVRWSPSEGWRILGGLSISVSALGIDGPGNALMLVNYLCPINFGLGYFSRDSDAAFCLDDLVLGGGWSFTSFASRGVLSDSMDPSAAGGLVALGYSAGSGAYRLARLVSAGELPAPGAVSLSATPHPGTWQQPYNSITLQWTSAGSLAKAYAIERRQTGGTGYAEIARVSASTLQYEDTEVVPLTSYDYRVAASGLAGTGPYSNTATVRAPAPMDTTAPQATITAPAAGATVSGSVVVSASFSDNVGVAYARLSFTPTTGTGILCTRTPSPAPTKLDVSCKWDTRKVAGQSPTATITAYVQDAMGNWSERSIDVAVTYGKSNGRGR